MKSEETLLLRVVRSERAERVPMWMMRQAGRYLPEYRAIRKDRSMLQMVQTPEVAAEVTLQPLKRFPLDAAIIFADILTPLIGMGVSLDFVAGEGPQLAPHIRTQADVDRLSLPHPSESVGYTLDAIRIVSRELAGKTPLFGFSGAPFTLSCYLIEGGSPGDAANVKRMMYSAPAVWHSLQDKLSQLVIEYLVAQVEAGADLLQLFDSWLGLLGPSDYKEYVEPYLLRIIDEVKARVSVPLIFFGTSTGGLFPQLSKLNADAFGVDWRLSLPDAETRLGRKIPLQGNLDPLLLCYGTWEKIRPEAERILNEGRGLAGHIFNLGHGILQETPIDNVERLVDFVRNFKA